MEGGLGAGVGEVPLRLRSNGTPHVELGALWHVSESNKEGRGNNQAPRTVLLLDPRPPPA